jgi:hypothetical protein
MRGRCAAANLARSGEISSHTHSFTLPPQPDQPPPLSSHTSIPFPSHPHTFPFCSAGRVRNACLVYADVALMLLQKGFTYAAHHLLDCMASVAAAEGW